MGSTPNTHTSETTTDCANLCCQVGNVCVCVCMCVYVCVCEKENESERTERVVYVYLEIQIFLLVCLTEEYPEMTRQTIKQKATTYLGTSEFSPHRNELETKTAIALSFRFYVFFHSLPSY